jgi:hypothetical protein
MEIIISAIIGIPVGIMCSTIAWWILFRKITPKIEFSKDISRKIKNEKSVLRIKFRNNGRRDIVDVQCYVRLYIEGLNPKRPNLIRVLELTLNLAEWPTLTAKSKSKISEISLKDINDFETDSYPEHIRLKANEQTLTVEDLLFLGSSCKIQMTVFAYDAFSGVRKVFLSKNYTIDDIKDGSFIPGTLKVVK